MFLLAMFEIKGEANIETLPLKIFVFVNEVFNKKIKKLMQNFCCKEP